MKSGIFWFDDDMVELRVHVSSGQSTFVNEVYAGHQQLEQLVSDLNRFKTRIHGGVFDMTFGSFSSEYAHGAFHARFHLQDRGIVFVTARSQTDFQDFGKKIVASEATLYLKTEPALLDNFIAEVKDMSDGKRDDVALETI